ncbi:hypothetical protein PHJA_002652100 [Phtheirospermum japonicum]|uniref:Uncharacterized protein n=1 Tax=Phtheirospermum japonicum TaxID=374723 RepID=A0A830D1C3_9LAMI|nr:hypothetical protein PHJA_002652100 [Phtheirospermum japonicum]
MACLEMYNQKNTEHHKGSAGAPPMMSPRISFSNDFVESQSHSHGHQLRAAAAYRDAPVSSDFEFSVSNYSMMSADELFFKGRLLPLKEGCSSSSSKTTTLRDELLHNDNEPPKSPAPAPAPATRWRGFLGLRKSHIGSKKSDNKRTPTFNHDDVQCTKNSQVSFFFLVLYVLCSIFLI